MSEEPFVEDLTPEERLAASDDLGAVDDRRCVAVAPDPVGPAGLLTLRGSTLALTDFRIEIAADGGITSNIRPQIAWEIWPLWLRVAIDHEVTALSARDRLLSLDGVGDDQARAETLEEETRAGLVTLSAVAFALEAMALSAARHAGLAPGIGKNASAARRIAELLKQCFAIPPSGFDKWRSALVTIFVARNEAVHPDAGLRDPLPHPALRAGVPRPAHVYRVENATAAVQVGIWTAVVAGRDPRARLGKPFREQTAAWSVFAEDLRQHRAAVVSHVTPDAGPSSDVDA